MGCSVAQLGLSACKQLKTEILGMLSVRMLLKGHGQMGVWSFSSNKLKVVSGTTPASEALVRFLIKITFFCCKAFPSLLLCSYERTNTLTQVCIKTHGTTL